MAISTRLTRGTPESQGIPSSAIQAFVDTAERDLHDLHSFILMRRGAVVAEGYWEPYGPTIPHMFFSLSKSFTSTAIGFLVDAGRLSVDDLVLDFFPNEAPPDPSDNLRAMRVRHLLTMTTGHHTDPTGKVRQAGPEWTRGFLAEPVEHEPGTYFVYNTVATYMLSAIAQRITGQRIVHFLQPRLFDPLGIAPPTWEQSPEGIDTGGFGLSATTPDIARFGQLYLQKGVWQGSRLLSEAWVNAATSRQVPNAPNANPDWEQGYGYQFWRCRHGAYRGDGAFGQFCLVMPDQEAVLAVTSGLGNMQAVLDAVWKHLLPALGSAKLADDAAAQRQLDQRLASLRLAPAVGGSESPRAAKLSGREFKLEENPDGLTAIGFEFGGGGSRLNVRSERDEQSIPTGNGKWTLSEGSLLRGRGAPDGSPSKLAASGAWRDESTFVVDLCWYETPFRRTLTCRFDGDKLTVDQKQNVGFGTTDLPSLAGKASG